MGLTTCSINLTNLVFSTTPSGDTTVNIDMRSTADDANNPSSWFSIQHNVVVHSNGAFDSPVGIPLTYGVTYELRVTGPCNIYYETVACPTTTTTSTTTTTTLAPSTTTTTTGGLVYELSVNVNNGSSDTSVTDVQIDGDSLFFSYPIAAGTNDSVGTAVHPTATVQVFWNSTSGNQHIILYDTNGIPHGVSGGCVNIGVGSSSHTWFGVDMTGGQPLTIQLYTGTC